MSDDYYKVLGISRGASQADIQKAYREKAREFHPDLHPDDRNAKENFQKVQTAFDVLNDPEKREMYDRYGSSFDAQGGPAGGRRPGASGGWGSSGPRGPSGFSGFSSAEGFDPSDIFNARYSEGGGGGFSDFFSQFTGGGERSRGGTRRGRKGRDVEHELAVAFKTSIEGGEAQLRLTRGDGKLETISVKIPAGISEGNKIRLRGQGEPGSRGGPAGDILLTIRVAPHPHFQRKGDDLVVRVPVSIGEAMLGATVDVPTPKGMISVRVPPGTSSGRKLRVRGLGVKRSDGSQGDLLAEIVVAVPEKIDEATRRAVEEIEQRNPLAPRNDLAW